MNPPESHWLNTPVFARFQAIAVERPEAIAVRDDAGHLTYAELLSKAKAIGQTLMRLTTVNQAVAIGVTVDRNFPAVMLGALATGRPYVPLDLGFPPERIRHILKHSSVRCVLTDSLTADSVASWMPPGTACVNIDEVSAAQADWQPTAQPGDVAYVLYTSGSTGQPKGVYQTQQGLAHDIYQYTLKSNIQTGDVLSCLYSPSVNGALRDIYGALLNGATLAIIDLKRMGFGTAVAALAAWNVSILHAMPPVLRSLLRHWPKEVTLPHIRLIYMAGDRLYASDVQLLRTTFHTNVQLYTGIGSTECATLYCDWFVEDALLGTHAVPVGRPIEARRLEVTNEHGLPVAAGEAGEVVIESRFIACGYWNDPALTAHSFQSGKHDPRARRFRTGDLARVRSDGLLDFLGRTDRQVKIRGYRADPCEAEAVLRSISGVMDAAVVVNRMQEQASLIAFIETDRTTLNAADARALTHSELKRCLPAHQRPVCVIVLDALPKLGNFKVDYTALEKLADSELTPNRTKTNTKQVAKTQNMEDQTTLSERETQIAEIRAIWMRVLKCAAERTDATFEALGGDSLMALELHISIERLLGRQVSTNWFSPELTLTQFISRCLPHHGTTDGTNTTPPPDSIAATQQQRTQIFLFPPASSVDFLTFTLRDVLARKFDVVVLSYELPPMALADNIVTIQNMAKSCVQKILAVRTGEAQPVLFGFSYGARIAQEAAAQCEAMGAVVSRLIIADVPPQNRHLFKTKNMLHQCQRWIRDGLVQLDRYWPVVSDRHWLIAANALNRPHSIPDWLVRANGLIGPVITNRQIQRWQPRKISTSTWVLVAKDTLEANPDLEATLGWNAYCDNVQSVEIPGQHITFFQPPHDKVFMEKLLKAISDQNMPP